jgi:hypothetical protein
MLRLRWALGRSVFSPDHKLAGELILPGFFVVHKRCGCSDLNAEIRPGVVASGGLDE